MDNIRHIQVDSGLVSEAINILKECRENIKKLNEALDHWCGDSGSPTCVLFYTDAIDLEELDNKIAELLDRFE